jgi:hypothetical protein
VGLVFACPVLQKDPLPQVIECSSPQNSPVGNPLWTKFFNIFRCKASTPVENMALLHISVLLLQGSLVLQDQVFFLSFLILLSSFFLLMLLFVVLLVSFL